MLEAVQHATLVAADSLTITLILMTRPIHDEPGYAHYLTFSCQRRLDHFLDDEIYFLFVNQLRWTCFKQQISLWAYVVMPNHAHVLVFPNGKPVGKFLKSLKMAVSRKALRLIQVRYPDIYDQLQISTGKKQRSRFWLKGGGYDELLTNEQAIRHKINYIHNNPVRRGLVDLFEEWKWSSARWWLEGCPDPIPLDNFTP